MESGTGEKMKHIKKYRKELSREEQEKIRSKARSKAKHTLSRKYHKEYLILVRKEFNKLRRNHIKELKGGRVKDDKKL